MTAATTASRLDALLAGLIDLERSRAFHEGRIALQPGRMQALLDALPDLPEPRVGVHVAGSEGKTSTTELIAAGLRAHGLRTATYTSPHLRDVRERLRIDGEFPPDALLEEATARVEAAVRRAGLQPSYFEFVTALARCLYALASVDSVVWETGLGGRLDATRLMPARLAVITTISLEHVAILGNSLAAIAREKAGIVRPGRPVVLGAGIPGEALDEIVRIAGELAAPVLMAPSGGPSAASRNVSLARRALQALSAEGALPPHGPRIDEALAVHRVEGRLERRGRVLFDGAHTVAAMGLLARSLAAEPLGAVVFGATSGRDPAAMLAPLEALGVPVWLTLAPGGRGIACEVLQAALAPGVVAHVVPDPPAALSAALEAARDRTVLVTGSLHLVGSLLSRLSC